MLTLGLSAAQRRIFNRTLTETHALRIDVDILNIDGNVLHKLNPLLDDGQVNIDVAGEVSRSASLTLIDPDHSLSFDSGSAADGALFMDRMVRVAYIVRCNDLPADDRWVRVPVFTGPIVQLNRSGDTVQIECHGKEVFTNCHAWRPRTFRKGGEKANVIRSILGDYGGETAFDFPERSEKLPKALSIGRQDNPWAIAKRLAESMSMRLFYDGRGVACLRRRGNNAFTFRDGNGGSVMSQLQVGYSIESVRNVVLVKGGVLKGTRKKLDPIPDKPGTPKDESQSVSEQLDKIQGLQAWAVAPHGHPLSPAALGPGASERVYLHVIENDKINRKRQAEKVANDALDALLEQTVSVAFDSMPIPHLDPWDRVKVSTAHGSFAFVMHQWSLPLKVAQAGDDRSPNLMSVGYTRSVSRPRRIKRSG